ncbi:hypothetical protein JW756_04015 [Candidatus Woesearchaeota archaeon]|nr:hypothetical protein [Candidatus Woesearchaeota archaeon]
MAEELISVNESIKKNTESKESRPSLIQRTRNFVKKKWVNFGLGAIVAGSMMMGSAKNMGAQAATPEEYTEPYNATEIYDTQRVQNDTFIAYVYEGDHDWRRDLDFVAEDLQKVNRSGEPLRIQVHEDYDFSNAEIISEVRRRINNPDKYPWIEMRGKFWPASPYGRYDGALNLEQIITKDDNGNEEIFFTDPANSNFYYLDDNYYFDWAFYPGRHLIGFYYPHFSRGFAPYWDWDMDGIPNWMDRHPLWWDPWDIWMCDPWNHYGWGWYNNWWVGSPFWGYWGNADHHWRRHRDHDHDFRNIITKISKKQLQDPKNRNEVRGYLKGLIESRDLKNVLDKDQLRSLNQARIERINKNYEMIRNNPNVTIRDKDGKELRMKMQLPENRPGYRLTPRSQQEPERQIRRYEPRSAEPGAREPRIQPRAQPEPRQGTIVKKDEPKKGEEKKDTPVVKKKDDEKDDGRSYSLSPRSEYNLRENSSDTKRTIYPSRLSSDDITRKLNEFDSSTRRIRTSPSDTNRDFSPRINYDNNRSSRSNYYLNRSSRSYTPSRSSSRPSISNRSYSRPSTSRSSSGSYKSSSSRSSSSSHRSSSGSVRKK